MAIQSDMTNENFVKVEVELRFSSYENLAVPAFKSNLRYCLSLQYIY